MNTDNDSRKYGIEILMPETDPFRAAHLLGDSWAAARWFETREQRDAALMQMRKHPGYYRKGDVPSVQYAEINPE